MDYTFGTDMIEFKGFTDENGAAISSLDSDEVNAVDGNYVIDLSDYGGGMITLLGVTADPSDNFNFVA